MNSVRESAEVKATPWWRGPGRRTPPVLAVLIGTFGILSVVRVITPIGRRHLEDLIEFVPVPASASAAAVTAAAGVLLVLLAHGLWRRQRRAWRAALVLCLLIAVSHLLSKFSIVAALIAVLLALVLFLSRRHFYADGDPTTRLIAVRAIALILGLGFVLGMGILVVYDDLDLPPTDDGFFYLVRGHDAGCGGGGSLGTDGNGAPRPSACP